MPMTPQGGQGARIPGKILRGTLLFVTVVIPTGLAVIEPNLIKALVPKNLSVRVSNCILSNNKIEINFHGPGPQAPLPTVTSTPNVIEVPDGPPLEPTATPVVWITRP